jgi:cytochrome c oxidase cbb3-type subunit II
MIRSLSFETQRYGAASVAGESVYDRPFQWGSKRTGPDLARVGAKYSDEWHRIHLRHPRDVVPESNMPGYPWLVNNSIDVVDLQRKMRVLRWLGDPYSDAAIAHVEDDVKDRSELDALIAYLQHLGVARTPEATAVAQVQP